jgi:hypothetical protein
MGFTCSQLASPWATVLLKQGTDTMPICYLHVGAHKTGTTALQKFMNENRQRLMRFNICYPEEGASRIGNHVQLVRALFDGASSSSKHPCRKKIEGEIYGSSGANLVISAEELQTRLHGSEFDGVVRYFQDRGYDVHVIMYLRNQPQALNSQYAERTKAFNLNADFVDFTSERLKRYRHILYSAYAKTLDRSGVSYTFRPYTEALRRRGIAWDFLDCILEGPYDKTQFVEPPRANASLGPIAIAAVRTLMQRLEERSLTLNERQRARCKRLFVDDNNGPRWKEQSSFNGLDTELIRRIEAKFAEDNEDFARRVWGRSWEEIYLDDSRRSMESNVFDPKRANGEERSLFEEMIDETWPKVQRIAADPTFAAQRNKRQSEIKTVQDAHVPADQTGGDCVRGGLFQRLVQWFRVASCDAWSSARTRGVVRAEP